MRRACGQLMRAKVQPRRCDASGQRRAARPEKLEEEGQYGWWPALDGEAYRSKLKSFSVHPKNRYSIQLIVCVLMPSSSQAFYIVKMYYVPIPLSIF